MTELNTIVPRNDDVVVKHIDMNKMTGSKLHLKEDADTHTAQYFEIMRVGPNVEHVSVGDVVVIGWRRITPPFIVEHEGVEMKVGITSETEILGIVEGA